MTVTVVERDGSQDHLSDDAVNELRTKLRGQLVVSDGPEARTEPREVWNAMHVDRPAITARCAGTADVIDGVNFARRLARVQGGAVLGEPLRELGTPLFDMSAPMPYAVVQSAFDPFVPRQALRSYWKSAYLDELTDDAIDAIASKALDRPATC
ncbi:MAG: hypothetical protein ACRDQI_16625 [Pseudonocardiaceae bacterium]